jgi:hypothetical protein
MASKVKISFWRNTCISFLFEGIQRCRYVFGGIDSFCVSLKKFKAADFFQGTLYYTTGTIPGLLCMCLYLADVQ